MARGREALPEPGDFLVTWDGVLYVCDESRGGRVYASPCPAAQTGGMSGQPAARRSWPARALEGGVVAQVWESEGGAPRCLNGVPAAHRAALSTPEGRLALAGRRMAEGPWLESHREVLDHNRRQQAGRGATG